VSERRIFPWIFCSLLVLGIAYLNVRDEVWFACSSEQRLRTPERAGAFARNYVIHDRDFWTARGVESLVEIEQIVGQQPFKRWRAPNYVGKDEPPATKGDYFIKDDSRWATYFSLTKKGVFLYDYELFFDDCGRNARSERMGLPETN
jgi:hypothetical protein